MFPCFHPPVLEFYSYVVTCSCFYMRMVHVMLERKPPQQPSTSLSSFSGCRNTQGLLEGPRLTQGRTGHNLARTHLSVSTLVLLTTRSLNPISPRRYASLLVFQGARLQRSFRKTTKHLLILILMEGGVFFSIFKFQ